MADGDELLIVDPREKDREGMRALFEGEGYVCTAVATADEAIALVEQKFFPAALVELDLGRPGTGLDLVRTIGEKSKPTGVVLLTGRRAFEAAVDAFRLGAVDVVVKRPDQIERLKKTVDAACERAGASRSHDLLRETANVLDESFRIMLEMGRQIHADVSMAAGAFRPKILVVDHEQAFLRDLAGRVQKRPWEVAGEMAGGAALDRGASFRFDIVACRLELMDLRGSMVLKSIQAQRAETVGILYSQAGDGVLEVYREGRSEETHRPFDGPAKLVTHLERIVRTMGSTQQDRKVIAAFRAAHEDFFRRYAELKLRLGKIFD